MGNFQAMDQSLVFQVVVDMGRGTANTQKAEPDDDEISTVHEIGGDQIARFHALGEEEVGPLDSAVVYLLPCVGFGAGPDAQVVAVLWNLGSKCVPQALAFGFDCLHCWRSWVWATLDIHTELFKVLCRIALRPQYGQILCNVILCIEVCGKARDSCQ